MSKSIEEKLVIIEQKAIKIPFLKKIGYYIEYHKLCSSLKQYEINLYSMRNLSKKQAPIHIA
jgi:hypothetical protein